ncbi:septal ring lytic transglycosylase RlpA family protein [Ignatzschineria cameli]|uniref:Endolytic peptidoglycan transglycosylase RlpA n=2 Tax=Bacteria TaxID=2 RepID=A0A2U2AQ56_9GAMM|nr:septal ring lytic transglycosylase RlpA family protein [Ignatzschineria cameli]PWD82901.1 hypothetical protein DC080_09345 [Ignatzschineria cameli]PWD85749.1 hypothetical protein DC077_06860 [Ignatzschineria cameli]PWD89378.1 hypothetical protein DC079_06485 [Ignatzschineria cameli]PWD90850.1 hypothetical protein DC081_06195 [Ignatzschineria cameli]PWD91638.1 hypothetical protein DC078_06480 [Ignatzschineria cameli]
MQLGRYQKIIFGSLLLLIAASCSSTGQHQYRTSVKGATPQDHPLSKSGNPASYVVFGKTYHLLPTSKGYKEKGMASWYGDKFHGKPTSSGEPYNMHAYTAAHKTLPIPSYVIVTNTETNKSITVLVNDRGPFVKGRIIDLSYAAAKELDVVKNGTAPVIVEAIGPYQYLDPTKKPKKNPVAEIKVSNPGTVQMAKLEESTISYQGEPIEVTWQEPPPQASATATTQQPYFNGDGDAYRSPSPQFIEESYQQQNSTATITSIDKRPVQQNAASYHIQLGSFGNEQNAINFQRSMANRLQQPTEVKYDKGLYRVYIGNYPTREEAGYAAFSLPVSTTVIHF